MAKDNATTQKIKGTVYWACLDKVNELSGQYQVDIGDLSDAAVKALESMDIDVKHKDEQGFYITCKSKHPIKAYDTDKDQIMTPIGNGSKALCLISTYSWTFKNKKGVSPSLKSFVITELVEYVNDAVVVDDEEAL